jgi:hypothetical protein
LQNRRDPPGPSAGVTPTRHARRLQAYVWQVGQELSAHLNKASTPCLGPGRSGPQQVQGVVPMRPGRRRLLRKRGVPDVIFRTAHKKTEIDYVFYIPGRFIHNQTSIPAEWAGQ